MNKRVVIDQDLCDKLQLMMAGKPRRERVAKLLGISIQTLDRIKQAGYDAEKYRENMRAQKQREQEEKKKRSAVNEIFSQSILITREEDDQVPGQMEMDLEEKKKPHTFQEALAMKAEEFGLEERDKKYMRFQAGQVEKICSMLTRIDDKLAQILRRMDK